MFEEPPAREEGRPGGDKLLHMALDGSTPGTPFELQSEGQTVAGDNRLSQPTGSMTHNPLRSRHLFN